MLFRSYIHFETRKPARDTARLTRAEAARRSASRSYSIASVAVSYTDMRIAKYVDSRTDEVKTSQSLVWTERGRLFINSLSKEGRI